MKLKDFRQLVGQRWPWQHWRESGALVLLAAALVSGFNPLRPTAPA